MSYTYAQAERILAILHRCEDEQKTAFRGRLKHLQRLGIPLGMHPGKGKKVLYSREHLLQWVLCLEFCAAGMEPTAVAAAVSNQWHSFYESIVQTRAAWICVTPTLLGVPDVEEASDFYFVTRGGMLDLFDQSENPRMIVIHFSKTLRRLRQVEQLMKAGE